MNKCFQHFPPTGNLFKLFCVHYIFILSSTYIYFILHYTLLLEFYTEIQAKHAYMEAVFHYVFDIRSNMYRLLLAITLFLIVPGVYIFVLESRPQHMNHLPENMRKTLKDELPGSIFSSKRLPKYLKKLDVSFPGKFAKNILTYLKNRLNTENKFVAGALKSIFYCIYLFAIAIYVLLLFLYGATCGIVGTIIACWFISFYDLFL